MATRQYIGARYVPKFYQNSVDGSAQWESNVVYEPLTYVTLTNGHMYISKKQVPATVGSPVSNIEYWLDIGSYNGFIEQLQDEIDTINTVTIPAVETDVALKQDITDNNLDTTNKTIVGAINELDTKLALKQNATDNNLNTTDKTVVGAINEVDSDIQTLANKIVQSIWHGKKVCVYGDSLSTTTHQFWQYLTAEDSSITVTNRAVGGTRIQDGYTLLQNATDLANFDIIVLQFGTNSWAASPIRTMINCYIDCFNEIATKNPTAQIITIAPFYSLNPDFGVSGVNTFGLSLYDYCEAIEYISSMYGAICYNLYKLANVNQWNYTSLIEMSVGGYYYHENETLGRRIAKILLSCGETTSTLIPAINYAVGTGTLLAYKTPQLTVLSQGGAVPVADLEAFTLPELAPFVWNANCMVLGNNGTLGTLIYKTDGSFAFVWNGTAPTTVTGINLVVFNGVYRPH